VSTLADQAARFRADARARVPGRLAELVEARVRGLLGVGDTPLADDLTDAERVVIDVAEQFLVDVHGLTDAQFGRLSEHYSPAEQVAIVFHLALVDGFTKLDAVGLEPVGA
jgi:hypothetical protein